MLLWSFRDRFLQCDPQLVLWLGSYAPPRQEHSVYVVVVNDDTYGGSGTSRVVSMSNQPAARNGLLIHELGHADGNLMDEYDYGVTEPKQLPDLLNCHYSQTVNVPWQHWIDSHRDPNVGVPSPVCSYTNYFKPTNEKCMMFSNSNPHILNFCSPCLETLTKAVHKDILDVTSPRCPLKDERTVVKLGEDVIFYFNHFFLQKVNVTLKASWTNSFGLVNDVTQFIRLSSSQAYFRTNSTYFGLGNQTIQMTIDDYPISVMGADTSKLFQMKTDFTVLIVDSVAKTGCKPKSCVMYQKTLMTTDSYCTICETTQGCNVSFVAAPVEFLSAEAAAATIQSFITSMALTVGGGFLLFFALFCVAGQVLKNRKRDTVRQARPIKWMRTIMLATSSLIMLASLGGFGYGMYKYQSLDLFAKSIDFAFMGGCIAIYIVAFIGFTATFFRSRLLMTINGIILILCLALSVFSTYEVMWVKNSIRTDDWKSFLQEYWINLVANNAAEACSLEKILGCSGFLQTCRTTGTNSYCPTNCDVQNKNGEACYSFITNYVETNFQYLFYIGLLCSFFFFFGVANNWAYCCTIEMKSVVKDKRIRQKLRQQQEQKANEQPFIPIFSEDPWKKSPVQPIDPRVGQQQHTAVETNEFVVKKTLPVDPWGSQRNLHIPQ